jgi:hypothetical protein
LLTNFPKIEINLKKGAYGCADGKADAVRRCLEDRKSDHINE